MLQSPVSEMSLLSFASSDTEYRIDSMSFPQDQVAARSVKIQEIAEKPKIIDMGPSSGSLPPNSSDAISTAGGHEAGVRHLFVAWTRGELPVILLAAAASAVVAGAKTSYALILGEIFQAISNFGSGTSSVHTTIHTISTWCLGLVGLGVGKALFSFLLMILWITHGESRARSVRLQLFQSLLAKEMAWFDTRRGGMSSLMTEQNT